jgi:hypothetical protein
LDLDDIKTDVTMSINKYAFQTHIAKHLEIQIKITTAA